ncbi:hypothetical protein BZB76_2785 [Actinomadura pelletieri DSM 43383]|uniref:Uncharacterized protein n=1 Tax=Actinomadura pelletieri DSM 43383 TaxID=1120940 RepID=A0A495QMS0_9ACTN|nr:DUF6463 family protein [Actinomadura pelletieri]RKS74275.1 hypothetical protein BZB76_2785 [Actinomadura pelletieri DSM 43383]
MKSLTPWVPRAIFFIALVHTLYAFATMADAWGDVLDAGFVDGIDGVPERESALWFFYAGVGLFALGSFARHAIRTTGALPASVSIYLVFIGATLTVLDPLSGGVLVLACGIATYLTTRSGRIPTTSNPDPERRTQMGHR